MMRAIAILLIGLVFSLSAISQQNNSEEDPTLQFKKSFIWAFTKYMEWPEHSYGESFDIAVHDHPELVPYLENLIVRYKDVKGLPIKVTQINGDLNKKQKSDFENVEIVVLRGSANDKKLNDLLGKSDTDQKSATLVICDECEGYGMLNFYEDANDKTKFELNKTKVESLGITVSHPLEDLAANRN